MVNRFSINRILKIERKIFISNFFFKLLLHREYKIRWKGFGPDDDTWEKQSDMANDIPQIVHSYESITKRILESRKTSKKFKRTAYALPKWYILG